MKTVGSRAEVFHGNAKRTSGRLVKDDLMKNAAGRIVSRKKHAAGKNALKFLHNKGYIAVKGKFGSARSVDVGSTAVATITKSSGGGKEKLDADNSGVQRIGVDVAPAVVVAVET